MSVVSFSGRPFIRNEYAYIADKLGDHVGWVAPNMLTGGYSYEVARREMHFVLHVVKMWVLQTSVVTDLHDLSGKVATSILDEAVETFIDQAYIYGLNDLSLNDVFERARDAERAGNYEPWQMLSHMAVYPQTFAPREGTQAYKRLQRVLHGGFKATLRQALSEHGEDT